MAKKRQKKSTFKPQSRAKTKAAAGLGVSGRASIAGAIPSWKVYANTPANPNKKDIVKAK